MFRTGLSYNAGSGYRAQLSGFLCGLDLDIFSFQVPSLLKKTSVWSWRSAWSPMLEIES